MSDFIHTLRQKPADVRNKIAIISAMSLTLVIVALWILVVKNEKTEVNVTKRSAGEDLKPLMMIFGGFKEGVADVKTNINNTKQDNQ